jgi:hypothetical protein
MAPSFFKDRPVQNSGADFCFRDLIPEIRPAASA